MVESLIVPPTPERLQHDPVGAYKARSMDAAGRLIEVETIQDSNGGIGRPFSVTSTIPLLYERKAINRAQVQAAFTYMDDFDTGRLHPLCASPLEIRGKGREDFSNAMMQARNRLWAARQALDIGTAVERAAWAVLGMRWNLAEWVENDGHPFSEPVAKRLLVTAIKELAKHYGYVRSGKEAIHQTIRVWKAAS